MQKKKSGFGEAYLLQLSSCVILLCFISQPSIEFPEDFDEVKNAKQVFINLFQLLCSVFSKFNHNFTLFVSHQCTPKQLQYSTRDKGK